LQWHHQKYHELVLSLSKHLELSFRKHGVKVEYGVENGVKVDVDVEKWM
jgi:hypothetical protein